MSTYARGGYWWYGFVFQGNRIQESTGIPVTGKNGLGGKQAANAAETARKAALLSKPELLIVKKAAAVTFSDAATALIASRVKWSPKTKLIRQNSLNRLGPHIGKLYLRELTVKPIAEYVAMRLKESKRDSAANRSINIDLELIRMVMIDHKAWEPIKDDVRKLWLDENEDVGKALTTEQAQAILNAAKQSISRSLYPALLLSIHTGLRSQELRTLTWANVDLIEGKVRVGKSKTQIGKGREVYLSEAGLDVLKDWRNQFPKAKPEHYVFPQEKYKMLPKGDSVVIGIDHSKPLGSWKRSFKTAQKRAKVTGVRWHDLRHTCASLLAAGRTPDHVMQAMLGWDRHSKMAQRYSHAAIEAKRAAAGLMAGIL